MADAPLPTLSRETRPIDQTKGAKRARYRGVTEPEIRAAVDAWGRIRWPQARVCHELVMDRGSVRLDIGFVSPRHLAVVELKSGYDSMERAIHQVGMARLASHEVWLICDARHKEDMRLIRYLLPSVGIAEMIGQGVNREVRILAEAAMAEPDPAVMCSLLWVPELARALGVGGARPGNHASLVRSLVAQPAERRVEMVCRELRGRNALWRADPPIREPAFT